MNKDIINGWMMLFRLVLPIMITVMFLYLKDIRNDYKELTKVTGNHIHSIDKRLYRIELHLGLNNQRR